MIEAGFKRALGAGVIAFIFGMIVHAFWPSFSWGFVIGTAIGTAVGNFVIGYLEY